MLFSQHYKWLRLVETGGRGPVFFAEDWGRGGWTSRPSCPSKDRLSTFTLPSSAQERVRHSFSGGGLPSTVHAGSDHSTPARVCPAKLSLNDKRHESPVTL